jgi:hypothetical protein
MTELALFLATYYLVAYRRPLWSLVLRSTDQERYAFGVLCFTLALLWAVTR